MRIFIASADERLRLALLLLLDHQPGKAVVGLADRVQGLLVQLAGSQPDVLILDWELSDQSLADRLTDLQELEHPPKMIVFSSRPESKEAVMAAGVDYYICKNAPPDDLIPVLNSLQLSETGQADTEDDWKISS